MNPEASVKQRILLTLCLAAACAATITASGRVAVYGIIERVVFEPSEQAPERLQVWGAFAYAESGAGAVSAIRRGYLYFRLPEPIPSMRYTPTAETLRVIKAEWADLKMVAGTNQAVAFGNWWYITTFDAFQDPAKSPTMPAFFMPNTANEKLDMRVRPASEPPASPAVYETNAGLVKLSDSGNQAALVRQLREAIGK